MRILFALALCGLMPLGCAPSPTQAADAAAGSEDHAEHEDHDDERLALTSEQVEAAGIQVLSAGPAHIESTLVLTAAVSVNLDAQSHVNPRVAGLVGVIHARLGDSVRKGDPLCEIDSAALGRAVSDYITAQSMERTTEKTLRREQELLSRNVELARKIFERERDLSEREITTLSARYSAERELQDAQLRQDSRILELDSKLARERIGLVAAERELELLGLSHEEVAKISARADSAHEPFGTYLIRAPRSGVIVARDVSEDEFVDGGTTLFEIQDLAHVWVQASLYEQDIALVRIGAKATVRLDAFPGTGFEGTVSFIDYRIKPGTRAASVRVELDNEPIEAWPEPFPIRPGMFGRVEITTGFRQVAVAVPEDAIVHERNGEFVFIQVEPSVFELRSVRIADATGEIVEIRDGLKPGEKVVVAGAFTLKSIARQGELGEGHSH